MALPDWTDGAPAFQDIDIGCFLADDKNPRKYASLDGIERLTASIKTFGVGQRIKVRQAPDPKKVIVVGGHRRLYAATKAKQKVIPCEMIFGEIDGTRRLEMLLNDNLHHEPMPPIDEALLYQEYMDREKISQLELSKRFSLNQMTLNCQMRMLQFPSDVQVLINTRKIKISPCIEILRYTEDTQERRRLAFLLAEKKITGEAIKKMAKNREEGERVTRNSRNTPSERKISIPGNHRIVVKISSTKQRLSDEQIAEALELAKLQLVVAMPDSSTSPKKALSGRRNSG